MGSFRTEQIEAANAFAASVINVLQTECGVHAETAIAGAARMAGTFLFRSFGFQQIGLAAGAVVLSEQANEAGPRLIRILGVTLDNLGVKLDPNRIGAGEANAAKPLLSFLETQGLLEPRFEEIRDGLGLSYAEAADAAALATAILIRQCASVLDPYVAFSVAMYGFVEGAKTMPALKQEPQAPDQ